MGLLRASRAAHIAILVILSSITTAPLEDVHLVYGPPVAQQAAQQVGSSLIQSLSTVKYEAIDYTLAQAEVLPDGAEPQLEEANATHAEPAATEIGRGARVSGLLASNATPPANGTAAAKAKTKANTTASEQALLRTWADEANATASEQALVHARANEASPRGRRPQVPEPPEPLQPNAEYYSESNATAGGVAATPARAEQGHEANVTEPGEALSHADEASAHGRKSHVPDALQQLSTQPKREKLAEKGPEVLPIWPVVQILSSVLPVPSLWAVVAPAYLQTRNLLHSHDGKGWAVLPLIVLLLLMVGGIFILSRTLGGLSGFSIPRRTDTSSSRTRLTPTRLLQSTPLMSTRQLAPPHRPTLTPSGSRAASFISSPQQPTRPLPEQQPFLSPSLKVPKGCECTLVVPRLLPAVQSGADELQICDLAGASVLLVSLCAGPKRLVLTSPGNSTVFAYCSDLQEASGGAVLALHGPSEPFGTLRSTGEIIAHCGWKARIGARANGGLSVVDEPGRVLAEAEDMAGNPPRRCLRIGSLVDAGLITLALLGADFLESAPRTETKSLTPPRG